MNNKTKILLLQVAALGFNFAKDRIVGDKFLGIPCRPVQTVFPALTCPVQATIRTASLPSRHGIVGNGFYFREQWKPLFWEQNSQLVMGPRIWDKYRLNGHKVGQMFIQQSLGKDSDLIVSPAPIHKHHGGMMMSCFTYPHELNDTLGKSLGVFPLHYYWGPLASIGSSRWISDAVIHVMQRNQADLIYAYIPHLDYDLQRFGPDSSQAKKALDLLQMVLKKIVESAAQEGYEVILFGDYAMASAQAVIYPNQILRESGFFKTRGVSQRQYPDLYTSAAFTVVDHQIAHVYIFDDGLKQQIQSVFSNVKGIEKVLDKEEQKEFGVDHIRSGELLLVAEPGFWFDYRWWRKNKEAPDYATHVDIHNKPGYDPGELFMGWPPPSTSQNPLKIKGTHGRVDSNQPVLLASTIKLPGNVENLLDLANCLREILDA